MVWRAVAGAAWTGTNIATLAERFKSQFSYADIKHTLHSLSIGRYIARKGPSTRYALWVITQRIPLGEERPEFLDEPELPHWSTNASAPANALRIPTSIFGLGQAAQQAAQATQRVPAGPCAGHRLTCHIVAPDGATQTIELGPELAPPVIRWLQLLVG